MRNYIFGVLCFFILNCASGQIDSVPEETLTELPEVEEPTPKPINGYPIGVGDELVITVWKNKDLSRKLRVTPSGQIFYPLVGEINVLGIGTEDLRIQITEGLSRYVISPQVNVGISTFRSRKMYVVGEVKRPGRLIIEDPLNVMDALTLAGGPTIHANMYKLILVRQSSNEMLVQSINVDRILTQGDASQMVYMASGDILFVPTVNMENVARFFDRVRRIFRAIVDVERSIILGDEVYDILRGEDRESTRRIIIEGDDDLFPP